MAEDGFNLLVQEHTALVLPRNLKSALSNYDLIIKQQKFEQETFNCGVCLKPRKGAICHRLELCGHVFCVECLQGYYNDCIREGNISCVKCLVPDCEKQSTALTPLVGESKQSKKRDRTLKPSELLQIALDKEIVQRYTRLRRQRRIESNRNTIYCPRKWCQGPSRLAHRHRRRNSTSDSDASDNEKDSFLVYDPDDPQSPRPPPSERLAICTACTFAFCLVCRSSWHGFYVPCPPPPSVASDVAVSVAAAMDKATRAYITEHTAVCPGCSARCQKESGCNRMVCRRCGTVFCYLCSRPIEGHFLEHFQPGKPCARRLWVLSEGDNGEELELFWDPHTGNGEVLKQLFAEEPKEAPSVRAVRWRQ